MKSLSAVTGDSILSRRRNPQPEEGKKEEENSTLDFWIFVYSEVAAYHTFKQLQFRVQLPMAPRASNVLRTAPRSASVAQRQAVEPTKSVKPLTSLRSFESVAWRRFSFCQFGERGEEEVGGQTENRASDVTLAFSENNKRQN